MKSSMFMLRTFNKKLIVLLSVCTIVLLFGIYNSPNNKVPQVFRFMIASFKHELGFNSSILNITRHGLFDSWQIQIGPYNNYVLAQVVSQHLSNLNYSVKIMKNNSTYYLYVGSFIDYKNAELVKNKLATDKYLQNS